jgi:putative ABC transport system permease protein
VLPLSLIKKSLLRSKMRSLMTLCVVALAFMLFAILGSVRQGIDGSVAISGADRLVTEPAVSGNRGMPRHYADLIASVPGVGSVALATHMAAYYQDEKSVFRVAGINPDGYFRTYPEILVPQAQLRNFLGDRRGALVGKTLAARMGWKLGDQIPIHGIGEVNVDGGTVWNVVIDAIYDTSTGGTNTSAMAVHYEFLNESRLGMRDTVDYVVSRTAPGLAAQAVADAIDARLADSSPPTRTTQQKADAVNQIHQIGDLGWIMLQIAFAVFFSMLLITIGVTVQGVRERTIEISLMRALGFQRLHITAMIVVESLSITLIGGTIGLGAAYAVVSAIKPQLAVFLEAFRMPGAIAWSCIALAVGFGLIAAVPPTIYATKLRIVNGLRNE